MQSKYTIPLAILAASAMILVGVGYAYTATISTTNNTIASTYMTLDLDGTATTIIPVDEIKYDTVTTIGPTHNFKYTVIGADAKPKSGETGYDAETNSGNGLNTYQIWGKRTVTIESSEEVTGATVTLSIPAIAAKSGLTYAVILSSTNPGPLGDAVDLTSSASDIKTIANTSNSLSWTIDLNATAIENSDSTTNTFYLAFLAKGITDGGTDDQYIQDFTELSVTLEASKT